MDTQIPQVNNYPTPNNTSKKLNKSVFVIILLTLVVIAAVLILILRINKPKNQVAKSTAAESLGYEIYTNSLYGYTVKYSPKYSLSDIQGPSNFASLKLNKLDSVNISPILFNTNISGDDNTNVPTDTTGMSFPDFAGKASRSYCLISTQEILFYCDRVISQAPYSNGQGLSGYVLYLNLVKKNLKDNTLTNSSWGPLYMLDVSKEKRGKLRSVLFSPLLDSQNPAVAEAEKSAADTLEFPLKTP